MPNDLKTIKFFSEKEKLLKVILCDLKYQLYQFQFSDNVSCKIKISIFLSTSTTASYIASPSKLRNLKCSIGKRVSSQPLDK